MGEMGIGEYVRHTGALIAERALRIDIRDESAGLQTASEQLRTNGRGILIIFTHLALQDGAAVLAMVKGQKDLTHVPFVMPMSEELYTQRHYGLLQKSAGVTFIPILTPEARLHTQDTKSQFGGLMRYLRTSKKTLSEGGIVAFAPQARGNTGVLDITKPTPAFSMFMKYMQRSRISAQSDINFSILPVGIYYPQSAARGASQKGLHALEPMRMNIGECIGSERIREESAADTWIYARLSELLPPVCITPV